MSYRTHSFTTTPFKPPLLAGWTITGIIYRDDSQVVLIHLGKRYESRIGVSVRIRECEENEEIYYVDSEFGWLEFNSGGENGGLGQAQTSSEGIL
jgi:hypothetical protein